MRMQCGVRSLGLILGLLIATGAVAAAPAPDPVRAKDLGRFLGAQDTALVGYGVVIGLAGSGDAPGNEVTQQALRNVLSRFGASVSPDQVRSRNVAAVMVTATIPPAANVGDRLDVNVSSIGDARSLLGGSLLMTPLMGADQRTYAVAQGAVVVGGYRFDASHNVEQKNHPTAGEVPGGAVVQTASAPELSGVQRELIFVLKEPDVTTAERLAEGVNSALGAAVARVRDSRSVVIDMAAGAGDPYRLMARIENLTVRPDASAKVVINERSGTVVAGSGVQISSVVISQGDIKVSVTVENQAAQPALAGGYAPGLRSLVVSNTKIAVSEPRDSFAVFPNSTVADLVQGLTKVHVRTREMIAILQAMRAAGALHAEIVVQ